MPAAETARLIAELEFRDKNFTKGIARVEKGIGRVDKKLGAFSGAVNRNLTRAVDTLIDKGIDAGEAVIDAAVQQESAITGISKTVDGNIDALVADLKKLSTETGSAFTDLAGIAELGGAMGIARDDLAAFTKQVNILGATTDVSVEDAATALGQLQNVIGLTGDEFDNFAASLVDLGNKGASTESQILEIAKRSGAAAALFGISKDETLGWASAVANLGVEAELGGTALQNLFLKAAPKFLKANKTMQKVTGKTAKELKQAFEKDAGAALQSFIGDLSKLSEGERLLTIQKLFGKGSGLTRVLLGLTNDTDNLTESIDTGTQAWKDATAAQAEADKRFATSEFLFKRLNASVDLAAATIGTELLPVLNDLATEGIEWLQKPETQKALKSFAVDLGKGLRSVATTLKGVDWGNIVNALSAVAGIGKEVVKAFLGLPDWAQAVLIGGFAANKITGGGVTGLLGKAFGKGIDLFAGRGSTPANPLFVSGTGIGGGPGGVAGKGGRFGGVGTFFAGAIAVTLTGEAIALQQQISQRSTEQAQTAQSNLDAMLAQDAKLSDMIVAQRATRDGIKEIRSNPLLTLVQGDALTTLESMDAQLTKAIAEKARPVIEGRAPANAAANQASIAAREGGGKTTPAELKAIQTKVQATTTAVKNARQIQSRENSAQKSELGNVKNAVATMDANQKAAAIAAAATAALQGALQAGRDALQRASTSNAGTNAANASRSAGSQTSTAIYAIGRQISAAVWASGAANRPIIQPTNVVEKYTTIVRTGGTSGSRNSGPLR